VELLVSLQKKMEMEQEHGNISLYSARGAGNEAFSRRRFFERSLPAAKRVEISKPQIVEIDLNAPCL
jgi:hypothetical protein